MTMRTSWPRLRRALLKPETTSPRPPVWARGVHSELMNKMRFLVGDDAAAGDPGFFDLVAGGVSMDFPALAADSEARAIRTRALGETGCESSLAAGGGATCFASAGFFLAPGFREALLSAGDTIEVEILLGPLLLPEGDFAMGQRIGSFSRRVKIKASCFDCVGWNIHSLTDRFYCMRSQDVTIWCGCFPPTILPTRW